MIGTDRTLAVMRVPGGRPAAAHRPGITPDLLQEAACRR